jgi:tetratricopeptide (TPR) repeat protein
MKHSRYSIPVVVFCIVLGSGSTARAAEQDATGHPAITIEMATASQFGVPLDVAKLVAFGTTAPDFFEFTVKGPYDLSAHAQTNAFDNHQLRIVLPKDDADLQRFKKDWVALQKESYKQSERWHDFYFDAAVQAMFDGDRDRAAFLLGYAMHNPQDYATHRGITNPDHAYLGWWGANPDHDVDSLWFAKQLTVREIQKFREKVGELLWKKFIKPGLATKGLAGALAEWDPRKGQLESPREGQVVDDRHWGALRDLLFGDGLTKNGLWYDHKLVMLEFLNVKRGPDDPPMPSAPTRAEYLKAVAEYELSPSDLTKLSRKVQGILSDVDWTRFGAPRPDYPAEKIAVDGTDPRYAWRMGDKDGRLSLEEKKDIKAHPENYVKVNGRYYYLIPRGKPLAALAPTRSIFERQPVLEMLDQQQPSANSDKPSNERLVMDEDLGTKEGQSVGGVRMYYDSIAVLQALRSKSAPETEKQLVKLAFRLEKEKDFEKRQALLEEFYRDTKVRLKADANLQTIDHLTAVSLKAVVEGAEKHKDHWDQLPAALRFPGKLTRIHGFVRVPDGQDILLLGTADQKAPPLELDDLIVAARSVWKERGVPTCSLDPDPDDMAAGRAGPQKVRLHGVPRDTGFAKTMLDADYEMKRIVFGTVATDVPGYLSLKELIRRSPDPAAETGSSRFWFYPVSPTGGEILAAPDGNIYLFSSGLQVLTEQVMFTREGTIRTGLVQQTREQAAESFTRHFAEIGEKKPVFRKLQTLTDLVLLASLWKEMRLRSDLLERVCALPCRSVATPDTYAGIKEDVVRTETLSFWLVGGVEMRVAAGPRSWLVLEDTEMSAVRKKVRALSFSDGPVQALDGLTLKVAVPSQAVRRHPAVQAVRADLKRGDLKAALKAADELVTAEPWDAEALVLRALVHLRRADYNRSRLDAANARAVDPDNPEIAAAVADIFFQCCWMEGNPDGALRAIEASLQQIPDRANAQVARAEVLTLLGKADEARKALLKAVQLNPTSALPCASLADLELSEGRTLAAKPWVQKALALDPNMPEVRIASAHWEMAIVRPDLSEKIARRVWEDEANGPTVRLQALAVLASVSAAREKWNDVERYIGLMEKLRAASPEVLVVAAEIAATWGERQRAVRYLAQAEKLSPRHPLVVKLRAKLGK